MKLNLMDRLIILNILPKKSNYTTLKIISDLENNLGITEQEYKDYDIKEKDGEVSWNIKGEEEKEFKIGLKAIDIIRKELARLNNTNQLTKQMLKLYEKIEVN